MHLRKRRREKFSQRLKEEQMVKKRPRVAKVRTENLLKRRRKRKRRIREVPVVFSMHHESKIIQSCACWVTGHRESGSRPSITQSL